MTTSRPVYSFDISSGGVLVIAHSTAPDDETYESFLDFCERHRASVRGYLILAGAGAPTAAQQARSTARFPRLFPVPTAIISYDASMTTSAAKALEVSRPVSKYAAFAPGESHAALAFLHVADDARSELLDLLESVAERVGLRWPERRLPALAHGHLPPR